MPQRRLDVDDDAHEPLLESQGKFGAHGAQSGGGARAGLARRHADEVNAEVRIARERPLLSRRERLGEGEIDGRRSAPDPVEEAPLAHDVRGREERLERAEVDAMELTNHAHDEARGAGLREAGAGERGHTARLAARAFSDNLTSLREAS